MITTDYKLNCKCDLQIEESLICTLIPINVSNKPINITNISELNQI